jgi:hypothetical protein
MAFGQALGLITAPITALAITKGWEWFVADTFGIASLSIVQAWGISWLVHILTYFYRPADADVEVNMRTIFNASFSGVFYSLVGLLSMFLLVQFR